MTEISTRYIEGSCHLLRKQQDLRQANYLCNHVVGIQQFDWLSQIVTSRIDNEGILFA